MTLAPVPNADQGTLAGIDREVGKIIGRDDGKTLDELERMREKYLFWYYIGLIVIVTSAILGVMAEIAFRKTHGSSEGVIRLLFMGWFLIILAALSPIYIYKNKARQILMPVLVPLFGNLAWSPHATDAERFWEDLRGSDLIGFFDANIARDYIAGEMNGIEVALMEMTLTRGNGKSRVIVFKGAGIHIHLQKPVPLRLILKPRGAEWNLFCVNSLVEVNIPSPEFTRAFHAYSDDQILARTLLTPDVVEQLTKLAALFGNRCLGVSLRGDSLFLIARGAGEFAPESLFASAYKLDRAHGVGRQLYLLSTLIGTIVKDWRLGAAAS